MPPKKNTNNQKNVSRASGNSKRTASSPKNVPETEARGAQIKTGVIGLITLALAVYLFVALFMESSGIIGNFINGLLRGLFSNAAYTICFMLAWIGISSFLAPKTKTSHKYLLSILALIFIALIRHLVEQPDPYNLPSGLYAWGQYGVYGGLVGGLIGNALISLIGVFGAWIVAITGIIVTFVLITGISIQIILSKFGEKIKAWRAKNKEARYIAEQERLERQEQLAQENERKQLEIPQQQKPSEPAASVIRPSNGERYGPIEKTYFDEYFNENDAPKEEPQPTAPERQFKLTIDNIEELVNNIEVETEAEIPTDADAPPSDTSEFKPPSLPQKLPGIDNTAEFAPPSLTQKLEDQNLNPDVQAALNAGVPMDEAISRAKSGNVEEIEKLTAMPSFENAPLPNYKPPPLSLLSKPPPRKQTATQLKHELNAKANKLLDTLASFGVEATIETVVQGPTVTRFEVIPGSGVKVNKITNLTDDIALALAATGVIIAPIAGKSAIGIEIPNEVPETVSVKEVIDTDDFMNFRSKTAFALGKDIAGNIVIADIAKMPHLLVAGATGSGKSVCINSLVTSILYKAKPNEVKMIMIDPKMVELTIYNGIPHLFIPVVTDSKKAASALNWAVLEMENRYKLFEANKCRNLTSYNELVERNGEDESAKLPEIIIIIDELADLMMVAKQDVESSISRLAAKARAAGMYLVIATQRPSVDVITGVIKANVPSRISFAVSSHIDSRTIIDTQGAEKLLGRGDMLYYPYGASKPLRIQGNFVSDADVENVVEYVKSQNVMEYSEEIIQQIENINETQKQEDEEDKPGNADELLPKAIEMAVELSQASVAMLQRRFKIGYQRAARIIDQMEERGIIGPYEGTKPRQVLISKEEFLEMCGANGW